MVDEPSYYDQKADNPPWIKSLAVDKVGNSAAAVRKELAA